MLKSQRSRSLLIAVLVLLAMPCLFVYLKRTSSIAKFAGVFIGVGLGSIFATLVGWWVSSGRR